MALKQIFECLRTLESLRIGPLGKLLEGFCSWLLEHGFSRWTIRKHLFNVSHLNEHLSGPRSGFREGLSSRDVDGFFKVYPLVCRRRGAMEGHVRRVRYSINRFLDYLRDSGLFDSSSRQEIYQPLLDAYLKWMRHYQTLPGRLSLPKSPGNGGKYRAERGNRRLPEGLRFRPY
jgi:hypothetical protein